MMRSREVKIILQTAYCTLAVISMIASWGFFDMTFRDDFQVYFSNWSNYFCFGVMFVQLIQTVKNKENGYSDLIYLLKFIGSISILITFFGYNFPDAERKPEWDYIINSVAFHVVLPITYIIDWLLFFERRKLKWIYSVYAAILPSIYSIFIFVRICILTSVVRVQSFEVILYPYFFFNIEDLGFIGAIFMCTLIVFGYMLVGFIFIGLDRMVRVKCI